MPQTMPSSPSSQASPKSVSFPGSPDDPKGSDISSKETASRRYSLNKPFVPAVKKLTIAEQVGKKLTRMQNKKPKVCVSQA